MELLMATSPHSGRVMGSTPEPRVRLFSEFSGFLLQSKYVHVSQIWIWGYACVRMCKRE